jgi:hypothetical protein
MFKFLNPLASLMSVYNRSYFVPLGAEVGAVGDGRLLLFFAKLANNQLLLQFYHNDCTSCVGHSRVWAWYYT